MKPVSSQKTSHPPVPSVRFLRSLRGQDYATQLLSIARHYGHFVKMSRMGSNYLVADPDLVHHILVAEREVYVKNPFFFKRLGKFLGSGLLTNLDESWKPERLFLQKAFRRECLPNYAEKTIAMTQRWLDEWKMGEPMDVGVEMLSLMASATADCFFSETLSAERARYLSEASLAGQRGVTRALFLNHWMPTRNNVRFQVALFKLNRYVKQLIEKRRMASHAPDDLLAMLLRGDVHHIPEQLIADEVKTFLMTGHETTGTALMWLWYLLSKNPACYKKLKQEVCTVLGDRVCQYSDLENLPYCQQVVAETLRLYPPIWGFPRCSVAANRLSGYDLPKGSGLMLSPYVVQRLPEYWDEPNAFKPERFSPEEKKKHHKHAYIPFGGGPHICIAKQLALMQAQIVTAMVVQRFDMNIVSQHPDEMPLELYVTLRPGQTILASVSETKRIDL